MEKHAILDKFQSGWNSMATLQPVNWHCL